MKKHIKTFISYSHDSMDHKRLVLGFANQLREQGIDCTIDQYEESPDEGWIEWMEKNISTSSYVLVVCTKGYLDKLYQKNTTIGKGVKWEGAIINQEIYDNEGKNRRFIPVFFGNENRNFIPRVLKSFTHYNLMNEFDYEKLYRRLTKQPAIRKPPLGKVVPFPRQAAEHSEAQKHKSKTKSINQVTTGNNNIQIGDVTGKISLHTQGKTKVLMLPPLGTIGANHLLKQAIKERFNKLGEEREKRFGKSAYSVMYKNFKRDFEIKNNAWTIIWEWPEATAKEIIKYLDDKFSNTIAGRNKVAIAKGTMIPAKGYLYAQEKELLAQLELEISSPEVKGALRKFFGVTSHTKLTKSKHWQWVLYLEAQVQKLIGEREI